MSVGSNVELTLSKVTDRNVVVTCTIISGSDESGEVVIFGSDNTEVVRGATISIVSGTSTNSTVSGLNSGVEYTAKFYSETESDYSLSTLTFTTQSHIKFYGSASNATALVHDLYGGASDQAQRITRLYGSVNGQKLDSYTGTIRTGGASNIYRFDATSFTNAIKAFPQIWNNKICSYVEIATTDKVNYTLTIYYTDGDSSIPYTGNYYDTTWNFYGITLKPIANISTGSDYIDLTPVYITGDFARLVHQGFGHLSYT